MSLFLNLHIETDDYLHRQEAIAAEKARLNPKPAVSQAGSSNPVAMCWGSHPQKQSKKLFESMAQGGKKKQLFAMEPKTKKWEDRW